MADHASGLQRALEIVRSLAQLGRNCGQHGDGPAALDAAAAVIESEIDEEPTDPGAAVVCQLCGGARRAQE